MESEFINFSLQLDILRLGKFVLKSGRESPYFFNLGCIHAGLPLSRLAEFYASVLLKVERDLDEVVLFGPAYKGIPIVTAVAIWLSMNKGLNLQIAYNRKEEKDHGEGGSLVGASLKGKRVVILDDVITAGTAMRQSIQLIQAQGGKVVGVIVAFDRQERIDLGSNLSTVQSLRNEQGIWVESIASFNDLIEWISNHKSNDDLKEINEYRQKYQANTST